MEPVQYLRIELAGAPEGEGLAEGDWEAETELLGESDAEGD